ncbi:DegV family protein [Micromonospora sp. Llam7]|uniref:DegV family protein n=1 Tax=Micromonospora tarapacensis TaxID=2835305 RepID=UPI001C83B23E|nr:DegV family protein [Micromonospora tarapacensis]MBX7265671.1 DegV family protein [Micromonospora tarapacensis]
MPVAVVTDSTAYLPAELVWAHQLTVVPLTVVLGGVEGLEGVETFPADATRALRARRVSVSTSRASPEQFARTYRALLDAGADGIVSVHLSAGLSGTVDAAELAAGQLGDRVQVVDSRSCGMGLGFPAIVAARAAERGADLAGVRAAAVEAVGRTSIYFYVDTLEFLRRGGRINAAEALLGTALSVKPILHMPDGGIVLRDKVRTASRGVARLVDLAAEAAGDARVDLAVHHLDAPRRAEDLLGALTARLGARLHAAYVTEAGAAVAAHVGPGLACAVIHRHPSRSPSPSRRSCSCGWGFVRLGPLCGCPRLHDRRRSVCARWDQRGWGRMGWGDGPG